MLLDIVEMYLVHGKCGSAVARSEETMGGG